MTESQDAREFWTRVADYCNLAVNALPFPHPDANFFRLAQQIAEEQAGLRERPAGLTPLEEYGFDPSSP